MKKVSFYLLSGILFIVSCTKVDNLNKDDASELSVAAGLPQGRSCESMEVLINNLAQDPGLRKRMDDIESFANKIISTRDAGRLLRDGTIEIPVVANVLYKLAVENISTAQIQSQIDVLNEDFKALNTDYSLTPAIFQNVRSGNVGVNFVLHTIFRKSTSKKSWGTNDAMKKSGTGGINTTNPTTELNLWSCNL